ncbi:unnamed protein product [Heligmosomoides polygyrus]|uniref:Uncharacterized protein n=1 Tax=Heligmosomoides polygyrus TaxID=6339 RepID=A0A183GM18_HELPZ|nr:unnamed protein product [Heligmosomoides polygyrus]
MGEAVSRFILEFVKSGAFGSLTKLLINSTHWCAIVSSTDPNMEAAGSRPAKTMETNSAASEENRAYCHVGRTSVAEAADFTDIEP